MTAVRFTVNGHQAEVDADPATALLLVLRNDLRLTGSRFGCGTGMCGACTVLVDGRPTESCNVPVEAVAGASVTTVEGLGTPHAPDPVQAALLEEQAGQCGYCLSGIVVAAAALFRDDATPSREAIRAALSGHLCRCGVQARVLRALDALSERNRAEAGVE